MIRNKLVAVRLSVPERDALLTLAQRDARTLSGMFRKLVLDAAARQGLWPPAANEGAREEQHVQAS